MMYDYFYCKQPHAGLSLRRMAALERWGLACATGAMICMVQKMLPLGRRMTAVPVGFL